MYFMLHLLGILVGVSLAFLTTGDVDSVIAGVSFLAGLRCGGGALRSNLIDYNKKIKYQTLLLL